MPGWQETCGAPTSPSCGHSRSSSAKRPTTLLQQSNTADVNQINGNTAWKGADGARFRSDWNGNHRALIQKTALALKEESKRLMTNAEQQEKASNAAAGAGGGSGVGSAGTPVPVHLSRARAAMTRGARTGLRTPNSPIAATAGTSMA